MNQELPPLFLEEMAALLGSQQLDAYLRSFDETPASGLRINTLKTNKTEIMELLGRELTPIPWISDGYYYPEDLQPSKNSCYHAGLYYLQEPSAMTPADRLHVVPGDIVLDLCAAPGGKATKLACSLEGKGMLYANDISNSRAKALVKNLEQFGAVNFCVTSEDSERLAAVYPCFFDKILIDAPCSGEGMFRRDAKMIKAWEAKPPASYVPIQRKLLCDAVQMLKPGGILLYSTCTFSKCENEENIAFLLKNHPELQLISPAKAEGFTDGFDGLSSCARIFPHKLHGEGHFLAMLQKEAPPEDKINTAPAALDSTYDSTPESLAAFMKQLLCEPYQRLFIRKDQVYQLPEGFYPSPGLRYLRTGLLLGTIKKNRFEPSQALAMTLSPNMVQNSISLPADDYRCIRYLKGETLDISDFTCRNGWCLVCMNRFPLGWGKVNGGVLKNYYSNGWRWQ